VALMKIPIQVEKRDLTARSNGGWSRKKLLVLYFACMPMIAALFIYWTMQPNTFIGLVSENIAAIVLFGLIYSNLRAYLERRRTQ
jgi:hypothetical protein